MRIAIVRTPGAPAGCGAALTASALAAAGHRVRIVTDAPGAPELVAPPDGPGTLRIDDPAGDMAAAWADEPPEVVHAIGPVAGCAAAATGLPLVVACPVDDTGMPAGAPAPGAARVLASSEDQHAVLLRAGVPRARLRLVPAGVDTGTFTPDGPALARRTHPRLVTVGSLATGAGADAAIRALARIPAAELLVGGGAAGDDPDRARLFAIAREAGVAGRVRFLGPVGHAALPRLLRSADVVVTAPEHDIPAGPVLQAMACARPVVATAVGGLRDAVVDRVTGGHVRPGHPDELAAAVREILTDEALRIGYGVAGRDRAVSRFDVARIAEALTRIYAEVTGTADGEPGDREPVGAAG
ncbi:glycosyltransferase [Pseudonocardia sp. C8]|uniref:glycosyltransferase n=1 Tax=Pseudonocardia sp. C8 TaxID=2762759 RepID=UPI0016433DD8|nr:glycosyltransferase [Pseudonocardia sp. C8]MBC3193026.1 glycosyltransferase [Pseudonocardia sp. C8]